MSAGNTFPKVSVLITDELTELSRLVPPVSWYIAVGFDVVTTSRVAANHPPLPGLNR